LTLIASNPLSLQCLQRGQFVKNLPRQQRRCGGFGASPFLASEDDENWKKGPSLVLKAVIVS